MRLLFDFEWGLARWLMVELFVQYLFCWHVIVLSTLINSSLWFSRRNLFDTFSLYFFWFIRLIGSLIITQFFSYAFIQHTFIRKHFILSTQLICNCALILHHYTTFNKLPHQIFDLFVFLENWLLHFLPKILLLLLKILNLLITKLDLLELFLFLVENLFELVLPK